MTKFTVFFLFLIVVACVHKGKQATGENVSEDTGNEYSIRYELFSTPDSGYGFNILRNDMIYIFQPIIPAWTGIQSFPSAKAAEAIASLITLKLQTKQFRFLLEKTEVDSVMKEFSINNNTSKRYKPQTQRTP